MLDGERLFAPASFAFYSENLRGFEEALEYYRHNIPKGVPKRSADCIAFPGFPGRGILSVSKQVDVPFSTHLVCSVFLYFYLRLTVSTSDPLAQKCSLTSMSNIFKLLFPFRYPTFCDILQTVSS